jgi:hypothetical protein
VIGPHKGASCLRLDKAGLKGSPLAFGLCLTSAFSLGGLRAIGAAMDPIVIAGIGMCSLKLLLDLLPQTVMISVVAAIGNRQQVGRQGIPPSPLPIEFVRPTFGLNPAYENSLPSSSSPRGPGAILRGAL